MHIDLIKNYIYQNCFISTYIANLERFYEKRNIRRSALTYSSNHKYDFMRYIL